ncbi:MAG: hypothetical protein SNJ74_12950, partial [Fimbriimonadaceae bacterium]
MKAKPSKNRLNPKPFFSFAFAFVPYPAADYEIVDIPTKLVRSIWQPGPWAYGQDFRHLAAYGLFPPQADEFESTHFWEVPPMDLVSRPGPNEAQAPPSIRCVAPSDTAVVHGDAMPTGPQRNTLQGWTIAARFPFGRHRSLFEAGVEEFAKL